MNSSLISEKKYLWELRKATGFDIFYVQSTAFRWKYASGQSVLCSVPDLCLGERPDIKVFTEGER